MKMNIKGKMIVAFLSLISFLVVILSFLSYEKARDILIATKKEASLETIENTRDFFIQGYIDQIEKALSILTANPNLPGVLNDPSLAKELIKEWEDYQRFNSSIYYIYMATRNGNIYLFPNRQLPKEYDPRFRPWYQTAINNPGKIAWSDPYMEAVSQKMVVSAVKTINDSQGLAGVFAIDISLNNLCEIIGKIKFGEEGYAMLLDEKGNVIAHRDKKILGQSVSREDWFLRLPASDKGVIFLNLVHKPTFVAYVTIPQTGWKLVGFIPQNAVEKEVAPIRNRTISVGLATLTIAIIVSILISDRIAGRIRKLIETMGQIEQGDWQVRCDYKSSDEFMELGNKFNHMLTHIEELMKSQKKTEEELNLQKAYFQQLFADSPESIAILDNQDRVMDINKQFEKLFQYSLEEIKGEYINNIIVPDKLKEEGSNLSNLVLNNQVVEKETIRKRKDGNCLDIFVLAYPIVFKDQQVGIYAIYRDITDRKAAEKQLRYLILHDALTGVYNRAYFEQQVRRLERECASMVGIIVCDLDGLKLVNDTLGHEMGDRLLKASAKVIRSSLPRDILLCRIGGDEFALLVPDSDQEAIEKICQGIRLAVDNFNQSNQDLSLSLSIGFAMGNLNNIDMKEIFKEADNNMYREKLHRSKSARSNIVKTLMKALEARDFITEGHGDRMQKLVEGLAREVAVPESRIGDLRLLAQFHDIGKVGIADRVLFKPGPLSLKEMEEMRRHSEIGYRIAMASPELNHIADWILKHHEWWNGEGYPLGIKEGEIPLECRILAIVDAYDAMTNDRPYRKAMSHQEAIKQLNMEAGVKFDPYLIKKFIQLLA